MRRDPSERERFVVKVYGAWSLLGLLSPLMTAFMVQRGTWTTPRDSSIHEIEKDAQEMVDRGYRIVSDERYELPLFGIAYEKVRYELADPTAR